MHFSYKLSTESFNAEGWTMVRYFNFFDTASKITLPMEEDFIGLYFNMGKAHQYKIAGFREGTIHKHRYNLIYVPHGSCEVGMPRGEYSSFCIQFTPIFLENFASRLITKDELKIDFLRCFHSKRAASLSEYNSTATEKMLDITRVMTANPHNFTGEAKRMYLYAKMME